MLLAVLLSGENADTQRQGKESMARGILLERLSQLSRTVQNGGFSWQPGSATQQGVSMIPLNSSLLGEVPEAGAHALINQLGAQGAFQYLMENRGFSMDNALSRPSAQQAYHILKAEGFSPETLRYLLESNGYRLDDTSQLSSLLGEVPEAGAHALINQLGAQGAFQYLMENRGFSMDNALSRPSAQQAYHILKTEGLSPETSRYLLERNGYSLKGISEKTGYAPELDPGPKGNLLENGWEEDFHLPKLLGDDAGEGGVESIENNGNSDIIRIDNFEIGRSLGAKAANYDVMDLETGEIYHFVEGTKIQDAQVFAGKGTKVKLRIADKYSGDHGGDPSNWQHAKGFGLLGTPDGERMAEVHWMQCPGIGKFDFFVKEWLD